MIDSVERFLRQARSRLVAYPQPEYKTDVFIQK